MKKKEFALKLLKNHEKLLNDIDYQNQILKELIDIGLEYSKLHHNDINSNKIITMMLQMSICKVSSILEASKGIKFNSSGIENNIIDVHSQSSIFRSLLENYCLFNHLFIQNWSKEEFTILYNLWRISSLNQRFDLISQNKSIISDSNKHKIESEKNFVDKLILEIKKTKIYQKNKNSLDKIIEKRRWQLTIQDDKTISISWKQLYSNTKKNSRNKDKIYQTLSLDAHPTYYAVFQFGELYKTRNDLNRGNLLLFQTIEILCAYLFDFEKLLIKDVHNDSYSYNLIHFLGKNEE